MENFSDKFNPPELPCRGDCFKQVPVNYKPISMFLDTTRRSTGLGSFIELNSTIYKASARSRKFCRTRYERSLAHANKWPAGKYTKLACAAGRRCKTHASSSYL